MLRKEVLIYGLLAGSTLFFINSTKFSYFSGLIELELFVAIIGILCLAIGVYLGLNWKTIYNIKSTSEVDIDSKIETSNNTDTLSPRELEVLLLLSKGMTNQEIADQLYVSLATIKTHTSNIYSKMNVKRRTQAVQKAIQVGLIHTHA